MIGWYVHHHGHGHLQRLQAVAAHLTEPLSVVSSLEAPHGWAGDWTVLPRDDAGAAPVDPTAGGVLHWVPVGDDGLLRRGTAVAAWVERVRPSLVVVDVSVEIALQVRLLGVPVAVVAMQGERTDRPHATAYDLAVGLVAPWPADAPEVGLPPAWAAKTHHVGAFSRFDGRELPTRPPTAATGDGRRQVLLLWGSGGTDVTEDDLAQARAATPGWRWTYRRAEPGVVTDVWPDLAAADVVVVHGGQNAVAEVAAARRPAVVVAQQRPHEEQVQRARTLEAAGIAVGLDRWPERDRWLELLDRAVAVGGGGWAWWAPGDGAARFAWAVEQLAREGSP